MTTSTYLFRHHVSQFDILRPRNRCGAMVVDQFVERVEFHHPQKEFALGVAKYLKVLNTVAASVSTNEKNIFKENAKHTMPDFTHCLTSKTNSNYKGNLILVDRFLRLLFVKEKHSSM